ncbi:conserved hypothetical protein [methanotrophic bacterial endosymbiont of Bathymodiolus sp.]|nr:conserved hypothetical protein [methanotrophic bacterial endosymbiont of Bathymodiolus sp.]
MIPKEKLYQQANVSAALKQRFVEQVGQIKWVYKLAEGTTNLAKTDSVTEIEIIQITLKSKGLDENILAAIDKAIPHPTLFVLKRYQNNQGDNDSNDESAESEQICITAAHKAKENIASGKETWQQSQYLNSAWFQPTQVTAMPLPTATNLERLYEQLLEALIPNSPEQNTSHPDDASSQISETKAKYQTEAINQAKQTTIKEKLATLAEIEALNKKLQQVKSKRGKEKQFNRRRELNDDYKALKKQIAQLQARI